MGAIIGPNLGGWIVGRYSWRYIFYINLPVGIVLLCLIMRCLSRIPGVRPRQRIDFEGASFFSGAILFFMLALTLIGESLTRRSVHGGNDCARPQLFISPDVFQAGKEGGDPDRRGWRS